MSPLVYDPGVGKATAAIQSAIDRGDTVWIEQAIVAVARLAPGDAVLPRVLRDGSVWSQAQRDDLLTSAKSHHPGVNLQAETVGVNFGTLLDEMNASARTEQAPIVNELHLVEALVKLGGSGLTRTGVNGPRLITRVAEMLGREEPAADDLSKTWCVCDTTFFQESRAPFDQVDWPNALGLASVVLVIPPVVVRELDEQKGDPRPHRSRQQGRARQILSRLDPLIDQGNGERPVRIRKDVEVLILDREPLTMPDGLDPQVNDDRVVASAVEFRWKHPGLQVAVLSDDRGPRIKAGRFDLKRIGLPDTERRQEPATLRSVDDGDPGGGRSLA